MVTETERSRNSAKGAPHQGIVKFPQGNGQLAVKFIEPGKTFDEALTNTRIMDEEFLRNIVLLHSKMQRFNDRGIFDNEIQSLISLLNGIRSLKGIGMNLAAMTDVDIYYPQGGGMTDMSKDDRAALLEMNRIKHGQRNHKVDSDNDDD